MLDYKLQKPVHGTIEKARYQCSIEWRNGKFISDEPPSSGGQDLGPDPHTLLISSLVSCTLITLRMYIDRKEWDIPSIRVNGNSYQTKIDEKIITVIDRDIKFLSPVTDEQRDKLMDIAKACPVSKILEGEIKIRTFVYNDSETPKQINYSNDDITVHWKPDVCKHSGRCVSHLHAVFNLNAHPWVNMQGAGTEAITKLIDECPTGALSYSVKQKPAT